MKIKTKKSLPLSNDELFALAKVEPFEVTSVEYGTDDLAVITLHGADQEIAFTRADILAEVRKADGATQRLPTGGEDERHEHWYEGDDVGPHGLGRPHDHVDAAIKIEPGDGKSGLVLRWSE